MAERKMPSPEDYPSNAIGYNPPAKREDIEPIARVQRRNDPWRSVFKETGNYILNGVLVPAAMDMIMDILHGSIDMTIGSYYDSVRYDGEYGRRSKRSRRNTRYDYHGAYEDPRYPSRERPYSRRNRVEDYEDFVFYNYTDDRGRRHNGHEDALDCLDFLCDEIDRYGEVSVARFYEKTGQTVPHDYISDDWGWTNLSSAKVKRVPGREEKYYIRFPELEDLR